MQTQVSTKPLDKVAGLVYLLQTYSILIYDTKQSAADAWEVLMDVMQPEFRAQLLFFYPVPGDGRKCWQPLWDQVMKNKTIMDHLGLHTGWVHWMEDEDADYYMGCLIESGNVRGLSEVQKEEEPQ
ncbi:hypothetical protein ARMGADRAFT_1029946 [Armillaria gallica]|uniref:Uncharacterized protein n=1 Tax=Armillaria gallica TaxID=47427 RepID=A0A2H3E378_ARMGA|nr:hypothetical protein ARMGADRAFT_1029946 [Armillaria gallica]